MWEYIVWYHLVDCVILKLVLLNSSHLSQVVQNLLNCLDSPELPFLQWQECFAVLATRLPKDLKNEVSKNGVVFPLIYAQNESLPSCDSLI